MESIDNYIVEAIKQKLTDFRLLNRDIENNIERLEHLESKMYGLSSSAISDMPRSPSPIKDKFADMIDRKDALENKIKSMIAKRDDEQKEIEEMLRVLRNPDEKAIINMRYLDCSEWDEITEMLYGFKENYEDCIESYKRRTFRLHGAALIKLAQVMAVG